MNFVFTKIVGGEVMTNIVRCDCGYRMTKEQDRDDEGYILNEWFECESCGLQEQISSRLHDDDPRKGQRFKKEKRKPEPIDVKRWNEILSIHLERDWTPEEEKELAEIEAAAKRNSELIDDADVPY